MSFFDPLEVLPEDPILGLAAAFRNESRQDKVNLGVGVYRDGEGNPKVLDVVRSAEKVLIEQKGNKEYLPISGMQDYIAATSNLVLGESSEVPIVGIQTIGASGALSVGGRLIKNCLPTEKAYISNPSWPNHRPLMEMSGLKVETYPYLDFKTHQIDMPALMKAIGCMVPGSVVLFQGSCHNPSGVDPSPAQWREIEEAVRKQRLIPFFDFAYQGFGEGLESDAEAIRYFAERGHEMFISVSHSKNFGLYGERVGALLITLKDQKEGAKVLSNLKRIVRSDYSTPPIHGAAIVKTVLGNSEMKERWLVELQQMYQRVKAMRSELVERLGQRGLNYEFLLKQKGFFSYPGFDELQVNRLREEFAIYMPSDGRINVAGLTHDNIEYVTNAIQKIVV